MDLSTPLVRTKPANHLMRRIGWSFLAIGTCTCLYWATDWATVTRPGQPRLLASEIVNAADSATGDVAPGEIVRLFPSNAGPVSLVGSQQGNGARLPLVLGDTRVLFDGVPAPLLWAVRGEIAAVVPYEVQAGTRARVVVEYRDRRSTAVRVRIKDRSPAIFTRAASGSGEASMLNQTGCCNSESNPAPRGSIAQVYATGAGQTNPAGIDGYVVPTLARTDDYAKPRGKVGVTVGGKDAEILYAGAAPHFVAGLVAVNFRVPMDAPIGSAVPVVLTVGGVSSPGAVTMAVRSERQRVLVIERRSTVLDWYRTVLSGEGFDVDAAHGDEDARARPTGAAIDAVVSDLPTGDSVQRRVETLRRIHGTGPQLRVAATVSALSPQNLMTADLIGAQMVLTEHSDAKQVAERLRQLLLPMPIHYDMPAEPGPLSPPTQHKDR